MPTPSEALRCRVPQYHSEGPLRGASGWKRDAVRPTVRPLLFHTGSWPIKPTVSRVHQAVLPIKVTVCGLTAAYNQIYERIDRSNTNWLLLFTVRSFNTSSLCSVTSSDLKRFKTLHMLQEQTRLLSVQADI